MLATSKLNSIEFLISKVLIDSNISHDEFVLINNVLKEYNDTKEEIKNLKIWPVYQKFLSVYKAKLSYCLKCWKNLENKNPKVLKIKSRRRMVLSKCAMCDSKKSKLIKKQEASGYLSSLAIKTPLSKIPLVGRLLF